ncbi:MAG TPA: hypothetical protein DCQ31_06360, partial [Bacteroidales bacterium]|nr:hypothetical protein [Bacteroidales bacterium]
PDLYNFEQRVWNRWTGEGTSQTQPRATAGGYNYLPSTHFIYDASFIRLRNLTLGYNLPKNLIQFMHAESFNIYLSGTNLITFTKFTGYSPEILGGPIDSGLDYGNYPVASLYSAGIRLTF